MVMAGTVALARLAHVYIMIADPVGMVTVFGVSDFGSPSRLPWDEAITVTRRALVLGSQIAGLTGVEHDTARMQDFLGERGFTVDLRTGANATRTGILDGYHRLIRDCGSDDAAVIYYSGHGHYAIDQGPATNQPRVIQGISPTDYEDSSESDYRGITSWELSLNLARLTAKTKNATVIFDCCHSSQMSRDAAVRDAVPRAFPHPLYLGFAPHLEVLRQRYPGELERLAPFGNPDAVRLVACGQAESAFEYTTKQGERTGAFTEALLAILGELGDAPLTWAALGQAIRQRVLRMFPSQRPDIEGPLRRLVFSLVEDDHRGIVPIAPASSGFRLQAGRLHGVSAGDVYGVMPLGARAFDRAKAFALVSITAASATAADAALQDWLNDHRAIPKDAVAVPHTIAPATRAVHVIAPDGERGAIERAIADTRTLRVAAAHDPDRPLATLRLASHELTIEDDRGPLFPAARYPAELEPTIKNLRNLGVAQGLRELEGEYGVAAERELAIELCVAEDGKPRKLPDHGASLGLGDRICVRVQSRTQRRLYVHVFNVGVRGKVTLLSGFAARGISLDKGDEYILGADDATGALAGYRLFWPEGLPMTFPRTDEIFVIVTTAAASLAGLETTELIARSAKRAPGTHLQELLTQLQDGLTRDAGGATPLDAFLIKRLSYFLYPATGQPRAEPRAHPRERSANST